MKATLTKQYLKVFLILFIITHTGAFAQTRLGLHVTQEELNIWKQRAANGPYKKKGDYSSNSPDDWTRITLNASRFLANPSIEYFVGYTGSGCVPVDSKEPNDKGARTRDAAFVYLVTGNTAYATEVRKLLLSQAKEPSTNFANKSLWCPNLHRDMNPTFFYAAWMTRLFFAYDYIKNTLSAQDKQILDTWFYNAALYFQYNIDKDLERLWKDRNNNDYTLINSNVGRGSDFTHYNGYKVASLAKWYNNRRSVQASFVTLVGIHRGDQSLMKTGKLFVKELLSYSTYPDGTVSEFERWTSDHPEKGWNYALVVVDHCMMIADHLARIGDYELYNYSTSKGMYGTEGGPKSLQSVATNLINYVTKKTERYATSDRNKIGNSNYRIDGVSPLEEISYVFDVWLAQPNVYFKNNYIKEGYSRRAANTNPYPSRAQPVGSHNAWTGGFGIFPGKLFMFGQMEGVVWPYPGASNPSITINFSVKAAKCYGGNEGSASVTVSGGKSPYTYLWSTGATTASVSGLKADEYTVTVTDASGQKQSKTVFITQPLAFNITKAVTNETAASKGSISLTVSGGTSPYTYKWSTGATTKDLTGLSAGSYTVTVTDANNCSINQSISISKTVSPLIVSLSSKPVTCNGSSNGSATSTVSGGTTPYTYAWSNGMTTASVSGLKAGEYTVTVTDQAGVKVSKTVTITQPTSISVSETVVDQTALANGSIKLTVSGGTSPYTYKWSTGATTKDLTGLSAGSYSVIVTDQNSCIVNKTFTINSMVSALSVSISSKAVKCYGGNEGSASVTVSGGKSPYAYLWSNGMTAASVSGLKAGEYTVTVTDQAGVKVSKTATITQPTAIGISETVVAETASSKGSIKLTVSGGTAPYSYKWSTGSTTKDLTNVSAGSYTVTVTDANNCSISETFNVDKDSPATMAVVSLSLMNAETDNAISAYSTLKEGDTLELATLPTRKLNIRANTTDPSKILKVVFGLNDNPEHRIDRHSPYSLDGDFRGDFDPWKLSPGKYTVVAKPYDSLHVKGISLTLTFYIVEKKSTSLAIQITPKQPACNGSSNGSVATMVTGGTTPYTYLWSNGATTASVLNLKAGEYAVTVTDKTGAKVSKTVTITQPSAISISETVVNQTASAKGSIKLTVSGGTAPYRYKWSNSVAAKDLIGITAGSYTITVTDANNCSVNKTIKVENELVAQVGVESLGLVNTDNTNQIAGYNPLQNGDTLDLSTLPTQNLSIIANTTDPKNILKVKFRLNATDNYRIENNPPYLLDGNNGNNYNAWKLKPGKHTVTATAYTKGNKAGKSVTVTFYLIEARKQPLAIIINGSNAGCSGAKGAASVTVKGGTAPYSYKWSNGMTTASVSGLKAGEYTVTVTDKAGVKVSKTVTITQPSAISISETVVDQIASAKGSISLTVSGGTAPYSYKWSTGATTKDLTNVSAGSYTVTVTDANNCSISETFNVQLQAALAINTSSTEVTCYEANNGSAAVTVSGGTAPYSYKWSNGMTTASVSGLKAGEYTVTVTDKAGTKLSETVAITQPTAINATETVVAETTSAKGSISLTVSGGKSPYGYKWSNGMTTQDLADLSAGSYTVTVTDANNCSFKRTIVVEKALPELAVLSLSLINADSDKVISTFATLKDGDVVELASLPTRKISIQANTTDPKYIKKVQFNLNNTVDYHREYNTPYCIAGSDGANVKPWNIVPGKYTLTAIPYDKDLVKGKTITVSFEIVERKNSPLAVQITPTHNDCFNGTQGSATVGVSGGASPYSYKWSNGMTTASVSGLKAGEYTVTVTDQAGVKVSKTVTITQPSAISISETVVDQTASDKGSIKLTISGGTAPYTYKWSTGAISRDLVNLSAGSYTVTVTDANNCSVSEMIEVRDTDNKGNEITPLVDCVLDNGDGTFTVTFGYVNASTEEITLSAGTSNFFEPAALKGDVPQAFLPGKHNRAFTAVFKNGTSLTWTIVGQDGTKKTAVANANTAKCFEIEISGITLKPNYLFSPNEDGIEDLWVIDNIEQHPDYEVVIFNRNGAKVFQAKPYTNNWDGRYQGAPLMAEAYYYVIRSASKGNIKTGTVTLIR